MDQLPRSRRRQPCEGSQQDIQPAAQAFARAEPQRPDVAELRIRIRRPVGRRQHHAEIGRAHVGHSLGAIVAAHLAGTRPDRVRTAVLHAAWHATDTWQDAEFRYWLDLLETGTFARMLPLMAFGPRYWEQATAESNEQLVKTLETAIQPGAARQSDADRAVDVRRVLANITAPVLVLGSAHDRLVTAAQQRELVAAIPHALPAEIDAGHGAPAELPDEFARLVLEFLSARA